MRGPARWIIVGAGAQGRITLDMLRAQGELLAVFLDDAPDRVGTQVLGVEVVGRDWLSSQPRSGWRTIIAVGRNDARLRLAEELGERGLQFGTVLHPSAVILPSATVAEGTVLAAGAIVGSGARVGPHAIINTRVVVEHDCVIGPGASLSPGVVMGGRVTVATGAFVGVGAVLNPRVTIGARSVIGAGAVVTCDVPAGMLAYGVPARVVRPVDPDRDWPRLL